MAVRGTSTRFIGRTDELAALDRLLSSGDDRLRLALIGGEAGIGKSRLVAEWARRARAAGAMVLIGGAIEVGEAAALPYVPLVEALRPLTAASNANAGGADEVGPIGPDLERLLPDLVASHGARSRSRRAGGLEEFAQVRLFEQTLGLLERLAA